MTGQPFLHAVLGSSAAIADEIAPGADLTADPSTWTWVDISSDVRHADGTTTTIGRADNVSASPVAQHGCGLNNPNGNYSPLEPNGSHYPNITRNMPFRRRMTLDGSTWFIRFQGYLSSLLPASLDLSGKVSTVALTALGMLGRVAGRKRPLRSALFRSISTMPNLIAYWPMEEGSTATFCAPAVGTSRLIPIAGSPPGFITGIPPTFGIDGPAGSAAAVDFISTGSFVSAIMRGSVPKSPVATSWRIAFVCRYNGGTNDNMVPLQLVCFDGSLFSLEFTGTGGSGFGFDLEYVPAQGVALGASGVCPWSDTDTTTWHPFQIVAVQNGADVDIAISYDDLVWHPSTPTTVLPATTLSQIKYVIPGNMYAGPTDPFGLCHLAVASPTAINPSLTAPDVAAATTGYLGETADDRLSRLFLENGIPFDLTGTSDTAMGPQTIDTLINLVRACETADHGILYDGLGPGAGYITRSAIYAIAAAYTLDMSAQEVTTPTAGFFDNQGVVNIVTAGRLNGGSATVERADGSTGTDLIGDDDEAVTLDVATDDVLPSHAGFLAALGSWPGYRVPQIAPNVRLIPATLPDLLAAGLRHRVDIENPQRRELGPDPLQLLAEGWTETTTADHWTLVLNTSSYAPWNVGVLDTDHLDTAGSECNANHSAGVTSFGVTTLSGPLWTTSVGDFPFDIRVNGERMTVTDITGSSSPQTFTVTRAVNGVSKATSTHDPVALWQPILLTL